MNKSIIEVGLVVAIVVVAWGGCVEAEPLNPDAFASLAAFPTAPGSYEFGTDPNNPIFVGPGVSLSGVIYHGLAVFDFDSVTIGNGMIVKSWGTALPLVVLSRSDFTITGTGQFDVSGFGTGTIYSSLPGVGGGHGGIQLISSPNGLGAGWGPGGGQPGMTHAFIFGAGGGGGFGGHGGTGGDGGPPFSGGPGGAAVQTDLFHQLQGGSGGGAGSQGGGGGGGAVEIGAVRSITIGGGGLLAGGGDGGLGSAVNDGHGGGGGGGGSGGVVFLHAD
ncbi:MAG TPA: hypothetical protein VGZ22_21115, partial [Isosphaeraceae bacterium]|nr:hypothetical protein [Isosphaeraceae bacterium]